MLWWNIFVILFISYWRLCTFLGVLRFIGSTQWRLNGKFVLFCFFSFFLFLFFLNTGSNYILLNRVFFLMLRLTCNNLHQSEHWHPIYTIFCEQLHHQIPQRPFWQALFADSLVAGGKYMLDRWSCQAIIPLTQKITTYKI